MVFAQLGVFVDGWTLDAAEAVCGPAALDCLATLMDQSLVTAAGGRFEMLETVREYALEVLDRVGGASRPSGAATPRPTPSWPSAPTRVCRAATSAPGWTACTPTARTSASRSASPPRTATRPPRCGCAASGATGSRAAT